MSEKNVELVKLESSKKGSQFPMNKNMLTRGFPTKVLVGRAPKQLYKIVFLSCLDEHVTEIETNAPARQLERSPNLA